MLVINDIKLLRFDFCFMGSLGKLRYEWRRESLKKIVFF